MAAERDLFENTSEGFIGVVTIEPGGTHKGISVGPGETVWLTKDEQVLTANAPKREENNPLTNGDLSVLSEAGSVENRRPLRPEAAPVAEETPAAPPAAPETPVPAAPPEETGAPPLPPQGEPEEGKLAPGEEVATPEAPAQNAAAKAEAVKAPETVPASKPAPDPVRPQVRAPKPVAK